MGFETARKDWEAIGRKDANATAGRLRMYHRHLLKGTGEEAAGLAESLAEDTGLRLGGFSQGAISRNRTVVHLLVNVGGYSYQEIAQASAEGGNPDGLDRAYYAYRAAKRDGSVPKKGDDFTVEHAMRVMDILRDNSILLSDLKDPKRGAKDEWMQIVMAAVNEARKAGKDAGKVATAIRGA